MNLGTLSGVAIAFGAFLVTVAMTFTNLLVLLDFKSILIVLGGTVGVGFICFPAKKIIKLLKVVARRIFGNKKRDYGALIQELSDLSKSWRKGPQAYEASVVTIKDYFLKDGAEALFWLESDVSPNDLRELLETRAQTHFDEYMAEAKIFKTIGKFPPAFGLMGTTIGLIALLQSIGGADGTDNLGPAMAVALITTLYGLFFANFIFVPIAENLEQQTHEDRVARLMVVEGLMLIQAGKPSKYVEEMAKSYLLPGARAQLNLKSGSGGSGTKAA